eukprot:6019079-Prymnesium_polylepis.2
MPVVAFDLTFGFDAFPQFHKPTNTCSPRPSPLSRSTRPSATFSFASCRRQSIATANSRPTPSRTADADGTPFGARTRDLVARSAPAQCRGGASTNLNESLFLLGFGRCRLEMWARMTAGGLEDMFVYCTFDGVDAGGLSPHRGNTGAGRKLVPLTKTSWYQDSIFVFEGEFTVQTDKERL